MPYKDLTKRRAHQRQYRQTEAFKDWWKRYNPTERNRLRQKRDRDKRKAKHREYNRLWRKSPQHRAKRAAEERQHRKDPEYKRKRLARQMLRYYLDKGVIQKPEQCSKCGAAGRIQAHHHLGYDKEHWIDVIWLCQFCHATTSKFPDSLAIKSDIEAV